MTSRSTWVAAAAALAVVAVVAAAVALSAGSGGETSTSAGGGASTAPGHAQPDGRASPSPDAPSPDAPSDRQRSSGLPRLLTIESYEVRGPQRLRVRYTNGVPECYGTLGRTRVVETADKVVVMLHRDPPKRGSATMVCAEIAVVRNTAVQLSEPLGGRTVVDGSDREPVRRGRVGR